MNLKMIFYVPPKCQGQMIETAYGNDEIGVYRRTFDKSEPNAKDHFEFAPWHAWTPENEPDCDFWNCEPDEPTEREYIAITGRNEMFKIVDDFNGFEDDRRYSNFQDAELELRKMESDFFDHLGHHNSSFRKVIVDADLDWTWNQTTNQFEWQ